MRFNASLSPVVFLSRDLLRTGGQVFFPCGLDAVQQIDRAVVLWVRHAYVYRKQQLSVWDPNFVSRFGPVRTPYHQVHRDLDFSEELGLAHHFLSPLPKPGGRADVKELLDFSQNYNITT